LSPVALRGSMLHTMSAALPQRRRIRLGDEAYFEIGAICSVTIGVRARAPIFANPSVAAAGVETLKGHATKTGVPIYGYCLMPDHVHLVLGASATCDIVTFVGQFKNLAQRAAWQQGVRGAFWQPSFWDHFLRHNEDVETVVTYVLNNPVRSGLVGRWQDYPSSGSLVFDLREQHAAALAPSQT
jgi:putative transposase